ncbi:hypothetical protein SORBI_3003G238750 [Sorghum bicolor]|uniref:Uncharacterized protein n=1 Tax=Sorghum bicolor TaxID=4558 RepID=A0A1W0VYN9_SORBI|nr:hypothetical protein SORBI_3003G238750 [Sorghum bicolor]
MMNYFAYITIHSSISSLYIWKDNFRQFKHSLSTPLHRTRTFPVPSPNTVHHTLFIELFFKILCYFPPHLIPLEISSLPK